MLFGKLVALSMIGAFFAGVGYGYVAERHTFPMSVKATATSTNTESVSTSVEIVATMPTKVKPTPEVLPASVKPYTMCSGAKRFHSVVDGDTIWHQSIRIADIDTPEFGAPKCSSEAALGARATKRLLQLVNAGPFRCSPCGAAMKTNTGESCEFSSVTVAVSAISS